MLKVLFVDDELGILEQGKIFLEREDERLDVETTTSGEEAIRKIRGGGIDAVIADYVLPDVDGVEIVRNVREEGNDVFFG